MDFLQAIKVPLDETVSFVTGFNGYPAFQFTNTSSIHKPALLFLEILPRDFSILVTTKMTTVEGGFLFAVVNPHSTIIQFGLSLTGGGLERTNITLYLSDSQDQTRPVAQYSVPSLLRQWTRFAIKIVDDEVTLFLDCEEYEQMTFQRHVTGLNIEAGSTLYVGQAGKMFKGHYAVSRTFCPLLTNSTLHIFKFRFNDTIYLVL